jgi:sarcosine oxidase
MFGSPDSETVAASRHVAEEYDIPHELIGDSGALRNRWPQIGFADGDVGLLDRDAGVLRPERAIRAAAGEAVRQGAELLTSSPVIGIDVGDDAVTVRTADEVIRARHAIVSAGSWTNRLLPITLPLEVRRALMAWFPAAPAELYRPGRLPSFVRESPGADGWGVPDVDGLGFKLGNDDPAKVRVLARPEDNDPAVMAGETAPAREFCRATFPGVDPRPAHVQVCMTTHTPDHDFVVGPLPGSDRVTVLAGFSGHGFKHAAGIGEIAAQLAADGGTRYDLSAFRPDRFPAN